MDRLAIRVAVRYLLAYPEAPDASTVHSLASKWISKYPELKDRIHRAVALVANVRPGDRSKNVFFVEGSGGSSYMVRVDRAAKNSTCQCPDSREGNHCKHRIAVALYEAGLKHKQLNLFSPKPQPYSRT